jgi:hypothetical protein
MLPIQMNTKRAPSSGRNWRPLGPMLLSSTDRKKLTTSSRTICSLPGLSTLSRDFTIRPEHEDDEADEGREHHVVRHVDVQRRQQSVDQLNKW